MNFENKGKWLMEFEEQINTDDLLAEDELDLVDGDSENTFNDEEQVDETCKYRNEVRYIDPANLDRYSKDEIEEVTTASGEKRYKRKSNGLASQPAKQQNAPAQKPRDAEALRQKVSSTIKNPKIAATIDSLKTDWNNIYNNFDYDRAPEIRDAQTYFKLKELEQKGVDVEKEFAGIIEGMSDYTNKRNEIDKKYDDLEKEAKERNLRIGSPEYEPYRQKFVELHNAKAQVRNDYKEKLGDDSDTVFNLYRVLSNYLDEKHKKPNAKDIRKSYTKIKNDYNKKIDTQLKKVEDKLKDAQAKNMSKDKQQELYDLYDRIRKASKI